MRQFITKEDLRRLARDVKEAEWRVQIAKDDLDQHRRLWLRETNEYWKEQRTIKARRKAKLFSKGEDKTL